MWQAVGGEGEVSGAWETWAKWVVWSVRWGLCGVWWRVEGVVAWLSEHGVEACEGRWGACGFGAVVEVFGFWLLAFGFVCFMLVHRGPNVLGLPKRLGPLVLAGP